jgi:hypothetical protein
MGSSDGTDLGKGAVVATGEAERQRVGAVAEGQDV